MDVQVRVHEDFDLGGGYALTQGVHDVPLEELSNYEAAILDGRMFFFKQSTEINALNQQVNEQVYKLYGADVTNLPENPLPISDGGTGQTTANAALNALLPSQTGNSGKFLQTNATNASWQTLTPTTPAGSNGEVQFNNSGAFGADSNLNWDNTNKRLGVGGSPSEPLSVFRNNLVTTISPAIGVRNTTLTNGANGNQISPALEFEAHGRNEAANADKKGLTRVYLRTPYQASGSTMHSYLLWQMDRGGIGSYNNVFEMVSPATQSPSDSNAFNFYRLDGNSGVALVVGSNLTASFYEPGTTNFIPVLGNAFGSHVSYQAYYVANPYAPKICAVFNEAITLQAGRGSDGAGVSGSEKVLCKIPFEMEDGKNFVFGTTTGTKLGTASNQKVGAYGVAPVAQPTVTGSRDGNAALASLITALASIGWVVDSSSA